MTPARIVALPQRARFEVLPDRDGGWSVTRDAVLLGVWPRQGNAMRYAAERAAVVVRAGGQAVVVIRRGNATLHSLRRFGRKTPEKIPGAILSNQ